MSATSLPADAAPAARVREWEATGDMGRLWPGVPESALRAAHRRLWAAAAAVLRDGAGSTALRAADATEAEVMGIAAFQAGMGPLLGAWVEQERLDVDAALRAVLLDHLAHGRRRARMLERETVAVLGALDAAGVPAVVLKGTHTGRVYFTEPACRVGSDVDLLVPASRLRDAEAVIEALDFRPVAREPGVPKSTWAPPGPAALHSLHLNHEANPWSAELHGDAAWRLFRGRTVRVPVRWDALGQVAIGTGTARVLPQPVLAALLAVHTSIHRPQPQLVRLVELALVIRRDLTTPASWAELLRFLRAHRLTAYAAPAFVTADRLVPGLLADAHGTAFRDALSARMRRWIDDLVAAGSFRGFTRSAAEKLLWVRTPLDLLLLGSEYVWSAQESVTGPRSLWLRRLRMLRAGRIALRDPSPGPERDQ